ncbi:ANTAR domain-containing protein [Vibrio navarrensis]
MSMPKKMLPKTIIVCCDTPAKQAQISDCLAKEYDQVIGCQLAQLESVIERESQVAVVVAWSAPCAEVRLIIEYCRRLQLPLLVLFHQVLPHQISQLSSCHDCVFLPLQGISTLSPWLTYAAARRESHLETEHKLTQLADKIEERKLVERAKGLLMKCQQVDENTAYQAMRRSAMQTSQSMAQVAKNLIATLTALEM